MSTSAPSRGLHPSGASIVVPRWEWRTFFEDGLPLTLSGTFGPEADGAKESNELYILSLGSPHNVKIRSDRLEIKRLEASERGLERWRPTLTTSFPVDATVIRAASEAWGVPAPVAIPRRATPDDFLRDVVESDTALRIVRLRKRRSRIMIDGCAAEHAVLDIEGRRWDTIAVEDADPDRVLRVVATLGLGQRANTNYPAALKSIVGLADWPT